MKSCILQDLKPKVSHEKKPDQHQMSSDLLSLQHKACLIHTLFHINISTKSQPYPSLSPEQVGRHNREAQIFSCWGELPMLPPPHTCHVLLLRPWSKTSPPSHKSQQFGETNAFGRQHLQLSPTQHGNHQQPGFNDRGQ